MSSQEAMRLLSDLRLGLDLGLIGDVSRRMLNELLIIIRPACLQYASGKELAARQRDIERGRQIRQRIATIERGKI